MKAAVKASSEGRPTLSVVEVEEPEPGPREVKVRVLAAGLNRADVMIAAGSLKAEGRPEVVGYEAAGVVVATGDGETRWRAGDRVCGMTRSGAFAEFAVARSDQLLPAPTAFAPAQAAAVPLAACTIWAHVFEHAGLAGGAWLLLHGGASGVGTFGVQLTRAMGLNTIATAGSARKVETCLSLGATAAIDYKDEDFVARVLQLTSGWGVDAVLDVVGGPYINRNLAALAPRGQLMVMGYQGGWQGELDLQLLNARMASIASVSYSRSDVARKAVIAQAVEARVWPLLETGAVVPVISEVVPLAEATRAFERIDDPESIGKVVVGVAGAGPDWEG